MQALSTAVLVIWLLLGLVAVRLFGFTPGQLCWVSGCRTGRPTVGIGRVAARGLLIALGGPAVVHRLRRAGMHDRVTGTAVVRR